MEKNKEVKYIGYYDILRDGKQIRSFSLAAAKKMDFVCDVINSLGYSVKIVSPAHVVGKGKKNYESETVKINENKMVVLPQSSEADNKIKRIIRVLRAKIWLFFYLVKNCSKNENVIVYHNYSLALPVVMARKFKHFNIVLEVEEIYAEVWKLSGFQRWKEKLLLHYANENSLVVSEVLQEKLKLENAIVSYGSYNAYEGVIPNKDWSGKVRLVFTGLTDKDRGSGFVAVETMLYLPEEYELYISGPVLKKDEKEFFELIKYVNDKRGRQVCTYMGILSEKEYSDLLLSAHIALNPQKEGGFSEFVFPSKILTYLSYGLPVVSTRGTSVVKSQVSDLITFADEFTGRSVAAAIENIKIKNAGEYFNRLNCLKMQFAKEFDEILKD